jgi:Protein of unknown function, DUF547
MHAANALAGFLTLALGLAAGCTTVRPQPFPEAPPSAPFSHAGLDAVLARFVDADGRVDYAGLVREPAELERYYARLAAVSPDSHPSQFPDQASRLAYWINAYNAAVLKLVKDRYPLGGVEDVPTPHGLLFVPGKVRFFVLHRILLGGRKTSLYALENGVVRRRFREPRIHFALNCASGGCPRLPQRAFRPESLDAQLEAEARRFVAERRNFEIDDDARTIWLSAIFDWYEGDFTEPLVRSDGPAPTLLDAVARWLPPEDAAGLRSRADGYRVRFRPYDWSLNDQATAARPGR